MHPFKKNPFFLFLYGLSFIGIVFHWTGCLDEPELDTLPFFEVEVTGVETNTLSSVLLSGRINRLESDLATQTVRYGFIITEEEEQPSLLTPGNITIADTLAIGSDFPYQLSLEGLSINVDRYYVWAFAKMGNREKISDASLNFSFKDSYTFTLDEIDFNNTALICRSTIIGLEEQGGAFLQHGHIYSKDSLLSLEDAAVFKHELNSLNDDGSFESEWGNLVANERYYARGYAISTTDTIYTKNTIGFNMCDTWTPGYDFFTDLRGGIAATLDGKAYFGVGCENKFTCSPLSNIREIWEFDPDADTPDEAFSLQTEFPGQHRVNGVAFGLKGHLYIGLGKSNSGNNTFTFLNDFHKYNPSTGMWSEEIVAPFPGIEREKAVAFVWNDLAYVGLGAKQGADYNDFFEYNPDDNTWRPIQSLPLGMNPSMTTEEGREGAIHFKIGDDHYVGFGKNDTELLGDIWKFVPPLSPGGSTEWQLIGFIPEEMANREGPLAFTIDGRAYVGLGGDLRGFGQEEIYFNFLDFWEFIPTNTSDNQWVKRTTFPGLGRNQAIAFSINGKGYIGTGQKQPNGSSSIPLKDFWIYTPKNN